MLTTRFLILFPFILLIACSSPSTPEGNNPSSKSWGWPHFGLEVPSSSPVLYAPGILSTQRHERDFAMDAAGKEIFFSYVHAGFSKSTVLTLKFENGSWGSLKVAPFSGAYNDLEPALSPDGQALFFISKRPEFLNDSTPDWNIWVSKRTNDGWGAAEIVNLPFDTEGNEFYPSLAKNGNLYFTATLDDGLGGEDIFVSDYKNGQYTMSRNLGAGVNSSFPEFNAYVAPDESFLLFSSYGRDDGYGGGDLYISYSDSTGAWLPALNMGAGINSEKIDYCPFVTSDMTTLFFTSERLDKAFSLHQKSRLDKLYAMEDRPANGLGDLYWMMFDAESWRKKFFMNH